MVSVVGPMALLLWLGLRSGHWRNADISMREERKRFFPIAIPILGLGTVIAWLAKAPGYVLRGQIITLLLLLVVAVTNRRSKISLHTLFATYCTVIVFDVDPRILVASGVVTSQRGRGAHRICLGSDGRNRCCVAAGLGLRPFLGLKKV